MAKRKTAEQAQDEQAQEPATETAQPRQPDKLDQAKAKLDRMQETNKIAFRHRDDLGRIEDDLKKFNYTPAELEYILEPKGAKGIPGFSFKDIERQKQYVNFLTTQRQPATGHADAQQQRRDQDAGQQQIG
jgi:hypothetical protein